ncbi:hypothetical protein [Methylobacterium sp. J-076]|uniref:hypothetical protein n=1 Tax=Methylobacterium sp. J-076 TaxID=2836655 RepID=UPI001FBA8EDB|nr:hypothetical protein [Methylobacterium sp. J-076]MCJ2010934.1 hypothetical protein [Methylobacterium sp. J-076]
MRSRLALGGAVILGLLAGPASAQVQQLNPNAANESFAVQSQFRSLNQQRTSDFNTLSMQAQRNVQFNPSPGFYGPLPRHGHRGVRAFRSRGGGINTSVCTGC